VIVQLLTSSFWFLFITYVTTGCKEPSTSGASPIARDAAVVSCVQPLEALCRSGACPTYPQAVERLREEVARSPRCRVGRTATCGGQRVVIFSSGFHGYRAFFDAYDALVGEITFRDDARDACHGHRTFGEVPTCEPAQLQVDEDLCPQPH
jgi:hypothetical protein